MWHVARARKILEGLAGEDDRKSLHTYKVGKLSDDLRSTKWLEQQFAKGGRLRGARVIASHEHDLEIRSNSDLNLRRHHASKQIYCVRDEHGYFGSARIAGRKECGLALAPVLAAAGGYFRDLHRERDLGRALRPYDERTGIAAKLVGGRDGVEWIQHCRSERHRHARHHRLRHCRSGADRRFRRGAITSRHHRGVVAFHALWPS